MLFFPVQDVNQNTSRLKHNLMINHYTVVALRSCLKYINWFFKDKNVFFLQLFILNLHERMLYKWCSLYIYIKTPKHIDYHRFNSNICLMFFGWWMRCDPFESTSNCFWDSWSDWQMITLIQEEKRIFFF